jgi:predicted O-methyltransferase YrrM
VNRRKATRLLLNLCRAKANPSGWRRSVEVARGAIDRGALQKLAEFAPLLALIAQRRSATLVEIGSAWGGTLWAWCQVADDEASIVSIDLPGGPFGPADSKPDGWESFARASQHVEVILGNSHAAETRARAEHATDGAIDFLFIDGDHTYDGVRSDFETYGPLVRPGGMIALHDIVQNPTLPPDHVGEVHRFWPELKRNFRSLELLDPTDDRGWGGRWGGIGVVFPQPGAAVTPRSP